MSISWNEWISAFVCVVVWFVRVAVSYLAGCAITFLALTTPYWLSQPQRQTVRNADVLAHDAQVRFLRRVLASTEDAWDDIFGRAGKRYEKPTLVLFTRATASACGPADAVAGPS